MQLHRSDETMSLRGRSVELKLSHDIDMSHATIRNFFNSIAWVLRSVPKKPLSTKSTQKLRMEHCKNFLYMTSAQRSRIVFSDESRFWLFENDSKKKQWVRKGAKNSKSLSNSKIHKGCDGLGPFFKHGCWKTCIC